MSKSPAQADPGHESAPTCTVCRSRDVRSSRSTYPRDQELLGDREGSFWRCSSCGARFLGPPVSELKRKRRGRQSSRDQEGRLSDSIAAERQAKRWIFPILVILATIVAVVFVLDRRAPPEERIFSLRSR